ncbi:MAG: response regulator [Verrucomicrobiales bacterium]|nr:response regulator [Verrucomicrobiales bacterium]
MNNALVLSVDDSEDDALLLRRAWRKAGTTLDLEVLDDGQKAIGYLEGWAKNSAQSNTTLPPFVLLDLNMPRMNGFEVLQWIQSRDALRQLPVCVFTSSGNVRDIEQAYQKGALAYVTKPGAYEGLLEFVAHLNSCLSQDITSGCLKTLPGFQPKPRS